MKYFKASGDNNIWIQYDSDTQQSKTVIKSDIENQIADIEKRLEDKEDVTDEKLLEWAKLNYPMINYTAEEAELESLKLTLKNLK